MLKKIALFVCFVVLFSILTNCGLTDSSNGNNVSVKVDLPLNKTAVYGEVFYQMQNDILVPISMTLAEYTFANSWEENNKRFLSGSVKVYYKMAGDTSNLIYAIDNNTYPVKISIDDKWLLFQYGGEPGANSYIGFLKQNQSSMDTLEIPVEGLMQMPSYPSIIKENHEYAAHRPADNNGNFLGLTRGFKTKGIINYNDDFGSEKGIYADVTHSLMNLDVKYKTIIDNHGIIFSQDSLSLVQTTQDNPDGGLEVVTYLMRRRLVDYSDAGEIKDKDYYFQQLAKYGLKPLK